MNKVLASVERAVQCRIGNAGEISDLLQHAGECWEVITDSAKLEEMGYASIGLRLMDDIEGRGKVLHVHNTDWVCIGHYRQVMVVSDEAYRVGYVVESDYDHDFAENREGELGEIMEDTELNGDVWDRYGRDKGSLFYVWGRMVMGMVSCGLMGLFVYALIFKVLEL